MDLAPEMTQLLINWLQSRDGGDSVKEIRPVRLRKILRLSVPDFQRHRTARGGTLPCKQWHNIKAVTRWMSSDAEASGEWVEKRGAATDHVEAVVVPEERTGQFRDPWLCYRVRVSLGGFGCLAFAFLIFLLKSIHMSSQEIGVCHLKLDHFFGADHCADFLLALRSSDETFVVRWFK